MIEPSQWKRLQPNVRRNTGGSFEERIIVIIDMQFGPAFNISKYQQILDIYRCSGLVKVFVGRCTHVSAVSEYISILTST